MKKHLLLAVSYLLTTLATAQNIGFGTTSPNPAALVHISLGTSLTKGFLVNGTYDFNATVPDLGAGSRMMFFPGKGAFRAGVVTGTEWDNTNVGQLSIALGFNTRAGYLGTALGYQTIADGGAAIAIGQNSTASGTHAIVLGEDNIAGGSNGICIGRASNAGGTLAIAMGTNTVASAIFSTAIGKNTAAIGESSTAIGHYTIASGTNSTALGSYTKAKGYASTVIGMYNDTILTTNQSSATSTTPLFIIGNGDNVSSRSNAMVVQKNGNTGIGITPTEKFHVAGNGLFTGTVTASCGVLSCSDIRYKTNITPIQHSLRSLLSLHGIYYNWDREKFPDKNFSDRRQIGISAQEVETFFPEIVFTDPDGYKTVDYTRLGPVLIEALKEQQQMISDQETRIESLATEIKEMKSIILKIQPK